VNLRPTNPPDDQLSDQRLEAWLRLAHAANEFERSAPHSAGRSPRQRGRRLLTLASGTLAAAMLALLAWTGFAPSAAPPAPTPTAPPTPIASTGSPTTPRPLAANEGLEPSGMVLLAVMQDEQGLLECVRWSDHSLASGQRMADLSAADLKQMGLQLACGDDPHTLLVVGLEGPSAMLPCSDERARELAMCLLTSEACSPLAFDRGACGRTGCADHGLQMRVESLAMR
jgi:hypothetical protein